MPRVLVVCEFSVLNGGERSLLAVLPTLQHGGWQIDFLAPPTGPLAEALRTLGIAIVGVRDDLAQVLATRRYDLVHANSLMMALFAGPIAAAAGVPSIGHLRDIMRLSGPKVAHLNVHTRVLAVSNAVREHHVAQGLDAAKTYVQYNGIDLSTFRPSPIAGEGQGVTGGKARDLRAELGLAPDAKLVGVVGQIILRKGQDTALTALGPLLQSDPLLHVVIVGERHSDKPETVEYERRLHAIAAESRAASQVHYLGTRSDMATLLLQLSLLLHMARQEPLGRVLLEAAACGVPVVATDVGGTREIFPHGRVDGAILVPKDDAVAARSRENAIGRIDGGPHHGHRGTTANRGGVHRRTSGGRAVATLQRNGLRPA
ncbi:MAG: glycosyltransferase family 4 protein [Pirellulales bacterium]